jgi:hypothetical protein
MDLTALTRKDFGFFCEAILKVKPGKMHCEWIERVQNSPKHLCIKAARGHLKTTFMSVYFPLWWMYRHPKATSLEDEQFVVIESATLDQATEIMRRIKLVLESNPILKHELYPENVWSTKWSETEILCKNGHRVKCIPFGDAVRGRHPNVAICDDVLTSETTNPEYVKEVFYSSVFPIGQGKGVKHVVIGTPQTFNDLLADLEQNKKETFETLKYPAIIMDTQGNWLRPQLPEYFTLEKLREIYNTQPAHVWAREYMVTPASSESSLFPGEIIDMCIALEYPPLTEEEAQRVEHFLGGDVALSASAGADFTVYIHIARVKGRPLELRAVHRFSGMPSDKQVEFVKQWHQQFHGSKILVELCPVSIEIVNKLKNDDMTRAIAEEFVTNKMNKSELLGGLELLMRNRGLKLFRHEILLQELAAFGIKKDRSGNMTFQGLGEHDDCVLSLALACKAAQMPSDVDIIGIKQPSLDDKIELGVQSF